MVMKQPVLNGEFEEGEGLKLVTLDQDAEVLGDKTRLYNTHVQVLSSKL